MTHMNKTRISLATALFSLVFGAAAVASAQPSGQEGRVRCEGKHEGASTPAERAQRAAERFQKADKNADGFLTQDEIGAKRWERMKVADANADGKLTQSEIVQAHKDGKLGRHEHSNS